jgi:hypothetical protein
MIMRRLLTLAAIAALAGPAYADCSYPQPPQKMPDGNTATLQDMVTANKAVKDYETAVNAYLACIKLEYDDAVGKAGDKPDADKKKILEQMERMTVQKHNATVDQAQAVADRFNEQVRAYKAKSDKAKG